MIRELQNYYLHKAEPVRSCLLALRTVILEKDSNLTETLKYGMPCFCYRKKAFCYLWTNKKTNQPYILMVEGRRLNHRKLEMGERKRMKILRVDAAQDLPIDIIDSVLNEALELYTKGVIKV